MIIPIPGGGQGHGLGKTHSACGDIVWVKINIVGIEIPVAVLGVAGYVSILAILLLEQRIGFLQQNGSLVFFGLSLMGFLFTLYLIYVEIALIRAFCPFCIASQVAMTLIFILSVIRVVRQP